jgi:hypothetical protein
MSYRTVSRHHRLPRSLGGTNTHPPGNVKKICTRKHQSWHHLVGNLSVHQIAEVLSDYIDPRFRLVVVPKES